MTQQAVKFYQVGSRAVGNRLLDLGLRTDAGRSRAAQRPDLRTPRLPGLRRGARPPATSLDTAYAVTGGRLLVA